MKDKILAALKKKYAHLGLDAKTLEGFAAIIAKTTTEETAIEQAVADYEDILKTTQAEADRRAAIEAAKVKNEQEKKDGGDSGKKDESEKKQEGTENESKTEKLLNQLMEKLNSQDAKIAAMESGKTAETRKSKFTATLKDMPEGKLRDRLQKDFDRMTFTDDEFEAHLTETAEFVKESVQEQANQSLRGTPRPFASSGTPSKEASKEEVDAVLNVM